MCYVGDPLMQNPSPKNQVYRDSKEKTWIANSQVVPLSVLSGTKNVPSHKKYAGRYFLPK